jgi:hypothetical protein
VPSAAEAGFGEGSCGTAKAVPFHKPLVAWLGWADEAVRPYVNSFGLAALVAVADYKNHSWAQDCEIPVVFL